MNAGKYSLAMVIWLAVFCGPAWADAARQAVSQGNALYGQGKFDEAIAKYDKALADSPKAEQAKFNKATSYYRLDDLAKAMDLYKEVAAESRDMNLVTKAKYNLGNCHFQQGIKQRDSDLEKAVEELKTAITNWRSVLDIDEKNEKAAKNIEVARLIIKDILDQINKQQQQQDQQKDQQNQQQQQDQQQQQGQQAQQQDKQQQNESQDPNDSKDPNEAQSQSSDPNDAKDPNESKPEEQNTRQQDQQQQQEQAVAPDATAQAILDKEQRQKQQRQILQRGRSQKVDKDW